MQIKATLSIDREVYRSFQEFCEANAIMLSKRIELVLKEIIAGTDNYKVGVRENKATKNSKTSRNITLSLDKKIYSDFKDYCREQGLILSRKIEIIMINLIKNFIEAKK